MPVPQLLWKYAKKSVALRVRYFTTLPKGEASHTALVQDIPGIPFGTQVNRVESVAPKSVAKKARPLLCLNLTCDLGLALYVQVSALGLHQAAEVLQERLGFDIKNKCGKTFRCSRSIWQRSNDPTNTGKSSVRTSVDSTLRPYMRL